LNNPKLKLKPNEPKNRPPYRRLRICPAVAPSHNAKLKKGKLAIRRPVFIYGPSGVALWQKERKRNGQQRAKNRRHFAQILHHLGFIGARHFPEPRDSTIGCHAVQGHSRSIGRKFRFRRFRISLWFLGFLLATNVVPVRDWPQFGVSVAGCVVADAAASEKSKRKPELAK
jgi:hypothetical protein